MADLVYPKAEWTKAHEGHSMLGGPPRGVLHETITAPTGFYTRYPYYHLQFQQWPVPDGPVRIRQFIPLNRGSNALRNLRDNQSWDGWMPESDVETNRYGTFNFNVALVGYQKPTGSYPGLYPLSDAMKEALAEFFVWAEEVAGIPADLSALVSEPGQQEYGYDSPLRLSPAEWRKFNGWCGHERVTENTHHDPSYLFPRDEIQELVEGLKFMSRFVDVPEEHWAHDAIEWAAETGLTVGSGTIDGKPAFRPEAPVTRAQMAVFLRRFHNKFGG